MSSASISRTRTAVLDAALQVFSERTVAGTTVPAISERAGVAVGTLYRHWPSKEALANAVYRQAKELFAEYLHRGAAGRAPADPEQLREAFEAMWDNLTAFAAEQPDALVFVEHQQHAGYLDEESRRLAERVDQMGADLIRAGQRLGLFRQTDPRLLTTMVFGVYVQLSKAHRAGSAALDADAWTEAREAVWSLLSR
ncbi:TetR family transcriptional regulator [Streptomyces nanhaiensis]|uniref:TetR family transcriptional regulator n=1 Tax=Streptomyces nanhaiensis TaxID=679319 RepID=UPI00399C5CBC